MPGRTKIGAPSSSSSNSKQKSLLSFFVKADNNDSGDERGRARKSGNETDKDEGTPLTPPAKRAKTEGDESESCSGSDSGVPPSPLTPEQRKMIQQKAMTARILKESRRLGIIDPTMGASWFSALETEFKKEYFVELSNFVTSQRARTTIYPKPESVWEWTRHCDVNSVKVVILGQDPYHGPNQAHGLCFSVQKGVPPPPSLVNMYKELQNDVEGFSAPGHGNLVGWASQGVLLLNAVLTVEAHKANSHKDKGWEKLTDAVISWISKNLENVVFLLWGSYAQKKAAIVDKRRHHLLQAVHPSPLSAHRGFFGCKHFSKCNEILIRNRMEPIDWKHLP